MLADRRRFALFALAPWFTLLGAAGACQQVPGDTYDGDDNDGWLKPDIPPWGEEDPPIPHPNDDDNDGETDGDGDPTGDPKLDTPPHEVPLEECSVVDLLFVIDNSGSMLTEQEHLIASFDGFVAGIQENLDEANDYHVGVVTTDAYALNAAQCQSLGALVTDSASGMCGPWALGRYISLADDLASSFTVCRPRRRSGQRRRATDRGRAASHLTAARRTGCVQRRLHPRRRALGARDHHR